MSKNNIISIPEKATQLFAEGLPFVIFSEVSSNTVQCFYQLDQKIHPFNRESQGFVVSPFNDSLISFTIPNTHRLDGPLPETVSNKSDIKLSSKPSVDDEKRYKSLVKKALQQIENKSLEKVVLARKECVSKHINPIKTFLKAAKYFPNTFTYLWHHPKIGTWLGATPEKLFSIKDNMLKTISLASTKKVSSTSDPWDKKEIHEHQVVTDWIHDALKKHHVKASKQGPESYQIGELFHLKTAFEGFIEHDFNPLKFIQDLHPTPAICGTPLKDAQAFITEYEGLNRGYYTGFIGIIENASQQSYHVNIRCMEVKTNEVDLYAGCGIVKGSDPKEEWMETVNKINAIKSITYDK